MTNDKNKHLQVFYICKNVKRTAVGIKVKNIEDVKKRDIKNANVGVPALLITHRNAAYAYLWRIIPTWQIGVLRIATKNYSKITDAIRDMSLNCKCKINGRVAYYFFLRQFEFAGGSCVNSLVNSKKQDVFKFVHNFSNRNWPLF